jgi:hypothetical protein
MRIKLILTAPVVIVMRVPRMCAATMSRIMRIRIIILMSLTSVSIVIVRMRRL